MFQVVAFMLLAAAQQSLPSGPPSGCQMYIYPVDEHGNVDSKAILNPSHIASIDFHSTDPYTGFRMWRVVLTNAGALINSTYTETHLRQKQAIFCGKQEVSRPEIVAKSTGTFVVIIPGSGH